MEFIDGEGNIIVPKSVRPIVNYNETHLGSTKGSKKQYRYKNLHIREYDSYYTIHTDKIDPRKNPIGHLLIDAPEYILGSIAALYVGSNIYKTIYEKKRKENNSLYELIVKGLITGVASGIVTYMTVQNTYDKIKKRKYAK